MNPRREYMAVLAAGVLGAALLLLAAGRPWAHGVVTGTPGHLEITASGRKVAPVATGLGLFAMAGVVAIIATRRIGRTVVGGLLGLAAVGILVDLIRVAADPARAMHEAAVEAAGLTSPTVQDAGLTGWPAVAGLAAVLVLSAGLAAIARGRRWPAMSVRYDRSRPASGPQRDVAGGGVPSGDRAGAATGDREEAAGGSPAAGRERQMWDAIDRGEDPTG